MISIQPVMANTSLTEENNSLLTGDEYKTGQTDNISEINQDNSEISDLVPDSVTIYNSEPELTGTEDEIPDDNSLITDVKYINPGNSGLDIESEIPADGISRVVKGNEKTKTCTNQNLMKDTTSCDGALPYIENRTVWYVDASAAEGGNGSKAEPFRQVQTALDACNISEKNTILIAHAGGIQYDSFVVEVPNLIIRSESDSPKEFPTISDPENTGVTISADNVWVCKLIITGCKATYEHPDLDESGGGIFVHDCKNTEIKRCTVTNNTAETGAGISFYNAKGAIRGNDLSENVAGMGGAVSAYNSSFWICNSTIHDNFASEGGAGIMILDSFSEIHNSEISENIALLGAGITSFNSENYIQRSNISDNLAMIGGGILDFASQTSFYWCDINYNRAFIGGAGIYSISSETELHDTDFIENEADKGAGYYGDNSRNEIFGCYFVRNYANSGAGIAINDGNTEICGTDIKYNRILADVENNDSVALQIQDKLNIPKEEINQGSISSQFLDEYSELIPCLSLSEISESVELITGIGILIEETDNITLCNNRISLNSPVKNQTSMILGGGVTFMNSSGVISGNIIEENYADLGAGIFCLNSTTEISDNTIKSNNATTGGAGICLMTGNTEISGNTVSYNNISGYGGGILTLAGESVISDNNFLSNTAGTGGAGICQIGSSSEILENNIESNIAGNESDIITGGGGILIMGLSPGLESSEIVSELSEISGPDFFATGTAESTARSTASEIYIEEDTLSADSDTLYDSYLSNEPDSVKSQMFSPGIEAESDDAVSGPETLIENNTISKNSALSEGGGVKLYSSATMLSGNEIKENSAPMGGGSEIEGSLVLIISDTIKSNNATLGGGLNVLSSECLIFESEITDNEVTEFGGGINTINGETLLLRTAVSDNTAGTGGGGINSIASALLISGGTIAGNSAPGSGNFSGGGGINVIDAGFRNSGIESFNSPGITDFSVFSAEDTADAGNEKIIHIIPSEENQDDYESDISLNSDYTGIESFISVNIINNTASLGGGVNIYGSENALISGCNLSENKASISGGGLSVISANNSGVVSSTISMNTAPEGGGIYIQDSHDFREFNNLFINDENILAKSTEPAPFAWNAWLNLTKVKIFTITGSPYSGGSVWAKPDGTGMSQTCIDADLDGICDSCTYTLTDTDGTTVGVDELPLYYNPEYGTLIVLTEPDGAEIKIDGKTYGRESDTGYYMTPGNYSVEITLQNYFNAPLITVPLKTKDRDHIKYEFTDIPKFRSTGSGHAPLNFVANATGTSTDLKAWKWHIVSPDGTDNSYEGESVRTYLNQTGNYTVTLDAVWESKTTTSVPKIIRVMDAPPKPKASEEASTKINGTETETLPDGSQVISINTSKAGNVTTTNDGIIVEKSDGTKIKIKTNATPSTSGGSVSGQVTSVTMEQPEIDALLGNGLGNASVGVSMTMGSYNENAGISTDISAGCADDARNAFSVAVPGLKEVAYTIYFTKSGFDNESAISEAVIDFSVNTSWVDSMGGPQRITIVRWKDDGTSENINPTYLGISGTESLFKVTTDGFSVYGVAGFSVQSSYESSRDDDNSVGITDAENLAAGKTTTLKLSSSAFTQISLTPAKDIPDLRITAQVMNYPKSSMGVPEDGNAAVMEYVKTVLYYTTSPSLENVAYTAEIPEKWLEDNDSPLPEIWYYNESALSWNMLEILNITEENGNKIVTVNAEMPGFGWFAVGSVTDEFITGETLTPGPGPVIPSEIPDETVKPESTKPAEPAGTEKTETPKPTATPLPGIVVLTGISLAAAFILIKREP